MMSLAEAKAYEGGQVSVTWINRKGEEILETVDVYEVTFVPMYGPCLVTNCGNIAEADDCVNSFTVESSQNCFK